MFGPGFGTAIAADGKVWVSNNVPGRSVSVFDNNGKPLTPADGITFDHKLGAMQGVLVMPGSGDVWVLDEEKNQLAYFPNGDPTMGRLVCTSVDGKSTEAPCTLFNGPFHLVQWTNRTGSGFRTHWARLSCGSRPLIRARLRNSRRVA